MTSTGLETTRKMPSKLDFFISAIMSLKIAAFLRMRSIRVSPGAWRAPAQMQTMSASAQSAYSPARIFMVDGAYASASRRSRASPSASSLLMSTRRSSLTCDC